MRAIECDQDGNPRIYYAVGVDPVDPQKVMPVVHEIRPGGMVIVKAVPSQRVTVAPDPVAPPTLAEVEAERMQRAQEAVERERESVAQEREAQAEAAPADAETAAAEAEEAEEAAAREATARRASQSKRKATARR